MAGIKIIAVPNPNNTKPRITIYIVLGNIAV